MEMDSYCNICNEIMDASLTYYEDDKCILYANINGPKIALKQHKHSITLSDLAYLLTIVRHKTTHHTLRLPKNTNGFQHFNLEIDDL